ncbi:MAG TPA: PEP-CTERM sorting domain-containing protein [Woeseiaceae bacterium]|nr:PEP-CTERM sorting domain-containing protein [Woeseiaceae bacterium]
MTNLGALSGVDRYGRSFSRANAINDVGQIVGSSTQCGENASYCGSTAVLWQNDTILDIGPFPSSRVQATDINNLGQVVGQWGDGNIFEMFYWRPDTGIVDPGDVPWPPKDISFGLDGERARGINDHGQVVGVLQGEYPDKKGFVWDQNSGFTPIGYDLGPGRRIEARDINNLGQIVGFNSDGYSGQGFIMIDGLMVEIGELSGGWSGSGPSSINDAGQVVGGSFLWDQYLGLLDLNDLISPLDPLYGSTTILNAFDINNYGQIVGVADFGGVRRGFLATPVPVPEPGTLALFGIGLLGMGLSRRRKKLSQVA